MSSLFRRRSLPDLETARLTLRFAQPEDIFAILRYYTINHPFLAPWEPRRSEDFLTETHWLEEVQNRIQAFHADQSMKLFLFDKTSTKTAEIIGSVNFSNFIRGALQACTLGYSIAERRQGQGYMTEALNRAIPYAFEVLHMHRIMANYIPHNRRSGKLLRRLGFRTEGYAKRYLYINGCWQDHILTSLVNPKD